MKRIMLHEDEIKSIMDNLEQKELKVSSHLYKRFSGRREMDFYSFEDLRNNTRSFDDFSNFCGMRDIDKYTIIIQLLDVIDMLKKCSGIEDDYKVVEKWALQANYMNHKQDIIGKIKGIGIATFQHLRMNFGANTVKPDQRVKEVLNHEFKFYADNDITDLADRAN